jgi:8-oxo-dGTP pyrophosphatase MutT (NUDIX family)
MPRPVSIKGVLLVDDRVLLVKNLRDEWELPGGRAEDDEDHAQALRREFAEELSIDVRLSAPIDSYLFEVIPGRDVFIVTYGCKLARKFRPMISHEHIECCLWPVTRLCELNLPVGYRRSIEAWKERVDAFRLTAVRLRPIFLVLSACLIGACIVHIQAIWRHGWLPYRFAPMPLNVYWTSLTFFDALAAVLLLLAPRAGLMLAFIIITSDVALNIFARFYLGVSLRNYFLVLQCAFLVAVVAVTFYARRAAAASRPVLVK